MTDTDDITLVLGAGSVLEIDTPTVVLVEQPTIRLDDSSLVLQLFEEITRVTVVPQTLATIAVPGLQGPPGAQGVQGDPGVQGPPGAPGSAPQAYHHVQAIASMVWTIPHFLGYYPNVEIVDSAGTNVEGDIAWPDTDHVVATFGAAFGGDAYLS